MSQEQAERARQQLYEDVSTRDELTDDEAEVLLHWGEAQIDKIASANLTDEQFDEAFANLARMMTRMNRFAARRADQAPDEQQTSLGRIVESAAAAGLPVVQPLTETFSVQAAPDTMTNLKALIDMFTPADSASALAVEPPRTLAPAAPSSIIPAEPAPTEKSYYDEEEEQQGDDFA